MHNGEQDRRHHPWHKHPNKQYEEIRRLRALSGAYAAIAANLELDAKLRSTIARGNKIWKPENNRS